MRMVWVLLVAALLRFHGLDAQSFWYDEGNTARIVERTPQLIIEAAAGDIHPPGYYLLLAGWRVLGGQTEFALRAFSAFWSLFTVAAAYALGARLFGRGRGMLGALVVALHAFQVYYAQEARMYAMLAGVAALSMYAFVRWLGNMDAHRWLAGWALLNALGLYTQYIYPVVMLVQGIVFVWWWTRKRVLRWWAGRRDVRSIALYTGANLVTLLLFVPWARVALRQIASWPTGGGDAPPGEALRGAVSLLAYGQPSGAAALWLTALLGAALWITFNRRAWRAALPLWVWALLPPAGMFVLSLHRESFLKALLIGHVPVALLMAWSSAQLKPKRIIQMLLGVSVAFGLFPLHDPANARADYRAIAHRIEAAAAPGDAVLLNAANQWEVFTYYYGETPDHMPVYPIPRARPPDPEATRAELAGILAEHDRLFVLYWGTEESDPAHIVESYLDSRAFEVDSAWYQGVRLVTYAVPPGGDEARTVKTDARFGESVWLVGYALSAPEPLAPGRALTLALHWQAKAPLDARYKVFVHLIDPGGALVAQHDAEPAAGQRPTDAWTPGARVVDHHGLLVPPDAVPGDYRLVVGMYPLYDPETRLSVALSGDPVGDVLTLATVTVSPSMSSMSR